jgi:hypothetical protein
MEELKVILPITLLAIGFLLKLVVSRHWNDIPNIIQNICELPVDIIFLALSFAVAFAISDVNNHDIGLLYSFVGIGLAIFVLLLRKISMDLFIVKKKLWILLFLINLVIASLSITESIKLIINEESSYSNNKPLDKTNVIDSKKAETKNIK